MKKLSPLMFILMLSASGCLHNSQRMSYQFLPPPGKTFLFIGQEKEAIDGYAAAIDVEPAGVMVYTSIQAVQGLQAPFDNGAGIHHGDYLMQQYPRSSLQIGLYMVDALEAVVDGSLDVNIDKLAAWISAQERPVYLRIGYEFDNDLNNYDPELYIRAYQRIVDRFRKLGVSNVAFVWHSDAHLLGKDPMLWFPGEEYVDWVAATLFSPAQYEKVKAMAELARKLDKPFMIAESSPMGEYSLQGRLGWFDKYFRIIEMLNPEMVCYINANWDIHPMFAEGRYGDARIEADPQLIEMWLERIKDERFVHAQQKR